MSDDKYLWDRSGEPDPEIARLEQLLGRYRHDDALRVTAMPRRRRWPLALAASLILVAATAGLLAYRFAWRPGAPWDIKSVSGAVTINNRPIDDAERLGVEQVLRTSGDAKAVLQLARVGEVEIGPDSEVQILSTTSNRHRMALERGTIRARLWAPPFTFGVRTRAGLASDIGCAFTLTYANGRGLVHVTNGWVDFDGVDRQTLVPRGAVAELREEFGAGSPYYPDAAPEFIHALRELDFERNRAALGTVLEKARRRDALTLIHLLEVTEDANEQRVIYDRLAALSPPPATVTREQILGRDIDAFDRWRKSLGLSGIKQWWIHWRDGLPKKR